MLPVTSAHLMFMVGRCGMGNTLYEGRLPIAARDSVIFCMCLRFGGSLS